MDLTAVLADLTAAKTAVDAAITKVSSLIPSPVPPPAPTPPPAPAPKPATNLQRMQQWLGMHTLGVYTGVWTAGWPNNHAQRFETEVAIPAHNAGIDYVMFKTGEWGLEWYNGTFPAIRDVGIKHGVGVVPYYYCHPETVEKDIAICVRNAKAAGGIVLDVEDEFALTHLSPTHARVDTRQALINLLSGIHAEVPGACIIVTGYGNPQGHFGGNFPHDVITSALTREIIQGYQPQWYIPVWAIYDQKGWEAALEWGDADCARAYGKSVPLQPCIMSEGMHEGDFEPIAHYLKNWNASLCVWEWQNLFTSQKNSKGEIEIVGNMTVIDALKAGLK